MQKLGQHFLKNAAVLEKIVEALTLTDNDRIIEIGPGHGELTVPLLRISKKLNCHITGIEKDRTLIPALTAINKEEGSDRLSIMEGDALKILPSVISPHYKIVGNIPYYITGKLLRTISELEIKPERTVLLIQEEVANRICAAPPEMNRLAASVQFWADATIVALVPRKDFSPPPKVDSAVVTLKKKTSTPNSGRQASGGESAASAEHYYRAVRAIFAQPRKTLLNNLSAMAGDVSGETMGKSDVAARLENIGINPGMRPQDLGIEQIIAITNAPLWG